MLPILDEKTLDYYRLLYKDNDGYVKIRDLSKRKSLSFEASDFLSKDEIMEDMKSFGSDNVYMSLATYKGTGHARKEDLLNVCALAIDCDYHAVHGQEDVTYEDMRWVLDLLFDGMIPRPTYIEHSRNLRLIYILDKPFRLIKDKKKRADCMKFLERIMECLCDRINHYNEDALFYGSELKFNVEPHKLTSFLRIPGSVNKRSYGSYDYNQRRYKILSVEKYYVDIEKTGSTWNINELADYVLPDLPDWYDNWKKQKHKKKNKKKNKKNCGQSLHDLCLRRISDLEHLQDHGWDVGYREKMCFLYRLFSLQAGLDEGTALKNTLAFNNKFHVPLTEHQVISQTKPSKSDLFYTNRKIISDLHCENEPVFQTMRKSNAEICRDYRKRKAGKSKKEKIIEFSEKVFEMRDSGKHFSDIADELSISIRTAKNYYKQYKTAA